MRRLLSLFLFCLSLAAVSGESFAVNPDEVLDDPALEARAREISKEVRCLVCQNEPIDSSNAELARELRLVVRERLVAGDSDQEVKDFLVARYGDFVLFRPPMHAGTFLLWFGPLLVFVAGGFGVLFFFRATKRAGGPAPLSAREREKLQSILGDQNGTAGKAQKTDQDRESEQ